MYTLLLTAINLFSILLLALSYRRMAKFTKGVLRKELRAPRSSSEVDVEKCLLD